MTRMAKLGLAAAAVGVVIAATAASAAGDKATPKLAEAQFAQLGGGQVRGLVVAEQRPKARQVTAHVSLHGLPAGAGAYLVAAVKQPCSRAVSDDLDGNVDAADYLVWRTPIPIANTAGDVHVRRTRLRAPMRSARSIRVFTRAAGGKFTQLACGRPQRWATFPSS